MLRTQFFNIKHYVYVAQSLPLFLTHAAADTASSPYKPINLTLFLCLLLSLYQTQFTYIKFIFHSQIILKKIEINK